MAQAVSAPQGLGVQRGSGAIISVGLSCLAVAMLQSNQSSFCHWVAFSVLPSSIMLWVSPAVRGLGSGKVRGFGFQTVRPVGAARRRARLKMFKELSAGLVS